MKLNQLIKELSELQKKHGDVEVVMRYDSGCLTSIDKARYRKKIAWNGYSEYSSYLYNCIVLYDYD